MDNAAENFRYRFSGSVCLSDREAAFKSLSTYGLVMSSGVGEPDRYPMP